MIESDILVRLGLFIVRFMSLERRLRVVTNAIAKTLDRFSDQPTRVEERPGRLFYITEQCAECWKRQSDQPCCHFTHGMLMEAATMVACGESVRVKEIECRATGGATCTFAIDWAVGI